MGDDFEFINVQLIQGGVLQIDFVNNTEKKSCRMFANGDDFFKKFGRSIKLNHIEEMKKQGWIPEGD